MPHPTRRSLFAGAALLLLAACGGPELASVAPVSFAGRPPIRLNLARIDTVNHSSTPGAQRVTPAPAIRDWAAARLQAGGRAGTGQLIIQEASLTREPLATQGGLTAVFRDQPSQRLILRLAARLEVGPVGAYTGGYTDVRVERSTTVTDGSSVADQNRAEAGLLQDGMNEFDRQFEANIRQYLAPLVLP
ncbi:hypothetical protein ACFW16_16745 [Inquilinus sp. NPDC058860]|uniref:hypothetical protein n=1 Tax=Inquilinus sp. NPDC058860 TaxID=3346652 RepID=UPI00368CCC30